MVNINVFTLDDDAPHIGMPEYRVEDCIGRSREGLVARADYLDKLVARSQLLKVEDRVV
jgi:hypothetical protein